MDRYVSLTSLLNSISNETVENNINQRVIFLECNFMDDENIKDLDYFVDIQPKKQIEFYESVLEGLSLPQKTISPKFLYDERGSKIFDKICDTPEYYLTRTEIALLNDIQEELYSLVEPGSAVVEYGCGSSIKIKALQSALPEPSHYIATEIFL